jgi:DNA-binding NarL/FixJ family response regulator
MDSLKRDPTILTRLTPREYEIIQLIGKGMDNQEIAETLNIEEQTARNYVSLIYRKVGAKNRVQMVLRAITLGLIYILVYVSIIN